MTDDLPGYYFRIRDNGAAVFRVDTENRNRRIELVEIATVNTRNGTVKPHGDTRLSPADQAGIAAWLVERRRILAAREAEEPQRTLEALNQTAHWAQARASDTELDAVTEALLMAMHDLRSILVRRKAERLATGEPRP
ncbi:MAG: hypothetical protein IAE87_08750 [Rhodobacteraceae bacterium]|jgi:hypothetical protein|nr:hypothetical protein [Paracoccaceae bacterium]